MRQDVVEFFQNLPIEKSEQFNKAFELYRKSPNKNVGVERSLNVQGYSERTLENLLYDLQKMHGISDVEKVAKPAPKKVIRTLEDFILAFSEEELRAWAQMDCVGIGVGLEEVIAIAIESGENDIACILQEELEIIKQALGDGTGGSDDDLEKGKEVEGIEGKRPDDSDSGEIIVNDAEVLRQAQDDSIDATLPLREEFPFLNDKECPNELKILVADKMTAWKVYTENHDKLLKIEAGELVVSKEEQAEIAQLATEAFEENQKIYNELNAYKETGKVLGVHPLFKTLQMQREVEEMDQAALIAYKNSSAKYFSTNKKDLAKAEANKDDEKIAEITTRVADRELKLSMVNKKLGIQTK